MTTRVIISAKRNGPAARTLPLLVVVACLSSCQVTGPHVTAYPRKPIKVIVPFAAGGGSDTFTRILQKAMNDQSLIPQPIVVINVPGAGGTVGARRVKHTRPDGYTLLQLHEGLLTSKYSGNADFGPEAFEAIAGTGRTAHVIAVREDAAFAALPDLLDAAQAAPNTVVFAVGIGAPSHFAGLMLENAVPGAEFRFTQSGGGAKRLASLLGGHTQVSTFSVSEFVEFRAGGLRALAVLSKDRHRLLAEVPTAKEQGIDVSSDNMHFWWAPKGVPQNRLRVVRTALQAAMSTDDVLNQLEELAIDPVVLTGDELTDDLRSREAQLAQVAPHEMPRLPNFPLLVLVACLLFGVLSLRSMDRRATTAGETGGVAPIDGRRLGLPVFVVLSCYIVAMQTGWLGFRSATCCFIVLTGGLLARWQVRPLFLVGCCGLLVSIGLHWLFTTVFIIDLPQ